MLRSVGPSYDLRAGMSRELREALDELAVANDNPRALHRCRVHVKRARALARIGRAGAPGLAAVFNDTARAVMRTLGRARDLTALADTARTLGAKAKKKTAAAFAAVAAKLDEERAVAPALNVEAARAGLKDLLALAMVWPEATPRQVRRGARRVLRRARAARRDGLHAKQAERRHEWRKRAKDRFYAAALLDAAWPAPRKLKLSDKLGDLLGQERDALLLIDRLKQTPEIAGEQKVAKQALKALRKRRNRLGDRADDMGKRLDRAGV